MESKVKCTMCGDEIYTMSKSRKYCIWCRDIKRREHAKRSREKKPDYRSDIAFKGKYIKLTHRRYELSATKRGLEFNLTIEDIESLYGSSCYYCGDPLIGIGIDRYDNNRGYIQGNIVPCCTECNFMKRSLDPIWFINHCKQIAKTHL